MAERMDTILQAAANYADAQVDYAAMHASILKIAQGKKRSLRRNVIRYASAAAAVLLLAGAGLSVMRRNNFDSMRGAGELTMPYGSTSQGMLGSQDGAVPESASSTADLLEPPSFCSSETTSLYWPEEELELPAVTFGTQTAIEADAAGFLCTVSNGTQADADAYAARVLDMYPGSSLLNARDTAQAQNETSIALLDGAYVLTVSFVQENVIIQAKAVND